MKYNGVIQRKIESSRMKAAPVTVDFDRLSAFFRADANVACATVFGSAADGMVEPGSDLDIAVLFREPLAAGEATLCYYTSLCDVVPEVERVDFINLNQANPILAFEALRGRMCCKNDPEATAAFTSLTCREYEDITGYLAYLRHQLAAAV